MVGSKPTGFTASRQALDISLLVLITLIVFSTYSLPLDAQFADGRDAAQAGRQPHRPEHCLCCYFNGCCAKSSEVHGGLVMPGGHGEHGVAVPIGVARSYSQGQPVVADPGEVVGVFFGYPSIGRDQPNSRVDRPGLSIAPALQKLLN